MKISKWLKISFSKKPGFWFFQIIGWFFMFLLDFFQSYNEIIHHRAPYIWVLSVFTGFCITLLLRKWYSIFYNQKRSIYYLTILILISSTFGGYLWYIIRISVLNPFQAFILDGAEYKVFFVPLYQTILRTLDYTWIFFIWSALYFGLKFWIDLIEAKDRSEKSALLAQKSQLQMLRYQLNPHFLFNSLNSIQALIYENPKHADKMIAELSDFLRFSIQDKDKLFIPLGEEVKIVEKYLSMEKTRFPDRLDYTVNVTEQASKVEVIAFILQPLVENAVKHGMKTCPEKLKIKVHGYAEAHRLYLEITNSGQWIENNQAEGAGIQNVFDRLQMAYPNNYKMHIYKNPSSVCVLLEIYF